VTVPPETVTATGMPPALNWAVVDAGTAGVVTSPAAVGQGTMTSEVSTNLLSAMSQRPCWGWRYGHPGARRQPAAVLAQASDKHLGRLNAIVAESRLIAAQSGCDRVIGLGQAVVAARSPGLWHSAPSAPDLAAGRHPWTVREQRT